MIDALILSGGVSHDFDDSSLALHELLAGAGIAAEIETDLDAAIDRLPSVGTLVFNTLRWSMRNAPRYEAMRHRWGYDVGAHLRDGIAAHLARGRGIVALHAASICFDDWPEWGDIVGARWVWDQSSHGPPGPAHVDFSGTHPIINGLPASFDIVDEIYTKLDVTTTASPLAWAQVAGQVDRHPVLWARETGGGRVIYDALGHDRRSILDPVHRELILRSMRWVANKA